ncbi:MAG: ABC transporter substrate-binding protein [Deltaproteobacteria bacterium]|nr:ABC transporter substrate-binding protein [Deltaproteobacteria bacterium]
MRSVRLIKRLGIYLLVLTVAVIFMAGFVGQAQAEEPRYGGILKIIDLGGPRAPGWPSSSSGMEMIDLYPCLEPLTKLDEKGDPFPYLLTSWEYSSDLKSLTLNIRKGVKFHDGSDLNAEAVKMNLWERKDGVNGWELASIASIDVIDEYTVRINLSVYKNVLLESFANFNGLMISPKVIEKAQTKKGKKWAKKNPVGTGPFKFVSFERDVMMKFEKFDQYWQKGKPYLDGIEAHYIANKLTQIMSLRGGEAHALWDAVVDKAVELEKEGFIIIGQPVSMRAIAGDSGHPESIFANKKVREAVEYAINRKELTRLGHGWWEPVNQYASKKANGYNPDLIGRPYNPERARQLLKEAGYPNGFKTKLIASVSDPRDALATIQRDLLKVGIDVKIEMYDSGKFFYTMIKGWKDGLCLFGQMSPVNLTQELNSLYIKGAARFPNLYRPTALQETLRKAETVPDLKEQKSLVQKAIRIMSDEAVVIPLWSRSELYVLHKSFHNPGFNGGRRGQWEPAGAWLSE